MSDTATRLTMAQFIERLGITMTFARVDRNLNMDNSDTMDHWRCTLRCGGRRVQIVFSKGSGHHGEPPTATELLDCMASDSAHLSDSFEAWCREYGYDTDSRRALRTHKACLAQRDKLARLLESTAAFETLLYEVERL